MSNDRRMSNDKLKSVKKGAKSGKKPEAVDFSDPRCYINEHLSLLSFHRRVLMQARAPENPLIEKFKFLAISATNMDEFFMVKAGAIYDRMDEDRLAPDRSGLTPERELERVSVYSHELMREQYEIYNELMSELKAARGAELKPVSALKREELEYVNNTFDEYVYPVVTPLAVDASRPFPLVQSGSINIGLVVTTQNRYKHFATVQLPQSLSRFVKTCARKDCKRFALLEDVIIANLDKLFSGCGIADVCVYRITRDADLIIEEATATNMLAEIERSIRTRRWGETMRLEVENSRSPVVDYLKSALAIEDMEVYETQGPINLAFCARIGDIIPDCAGLEYPPFLPTIPRELQSRDIYEAMAERDILLHHPYESFQPVVDFVEKAASDPNVLAIKQTLYRVSGDSPIVKALAQAAENGKQVTVLLEVKARFDEENNIHWAKRLERAGCHVIYGLVGLKTHCKVTLVVRLVQGAIKRYVHLGTGNYNDVTARVYTDLSYFTTDAQIGADATAVFNMLTGFSQRLTLGKLVMAPDSLRIKLVDLIRRETENARAGRYAAITAKMNGLTDGELASELYAAAAAGVCVRLIVRGMCIIKPDPLGSFKFPIEIVSVVGRFLEHSRIFVFQNDGEPETFISSADWMLRNMDHRVELLAPICGKAMCEEIMKTLETMLGDDVKARALQNDESYARPAPAEKPMDSQNWFLREYKTRAVSRTQKTSAQFVPILGK